MSDRDMVESVARAIAPVVLTYIEDYDEVPPDHIWTRPRHQWLSFAMTKIATAALSVIESRVRAEERERAARIAEAKFANREWDAPYRNAGLMIAAAIRSGSEG